MNAEEIVQKAREHCRKLGKTPENGITGLSRTDGEWVVAVEVLERKAIPDTMDMLGLYEVHLDTIGDLVGFSRKTLRKRGEARQD